MGDDLSSIHVGLQTWSKVKWTFVPELWLQLYVGLK
jgi:hypothetical protein